MRRGHTSVLLIRHGDDQRSHSPLNTLLRHTPPRSQPGAGHAGSLSPSFPLARWFPAFPWSLPPSLTHTHTLSLGCNGLLYTMLEESSGPILFKFFKWMKTTLDINPNACKQTLAHRDHHQLGESHQHSTPWNPSYQLVLSRCYIYPTTTPETNTLSHFPHSALYQIRAR